MHFSFLKLKKIEKSGTVASSSKPTLLGFEIVFCTVGKEEKENERFLLYAVFFKGITQPRVYTVYVNRPFTGLTSSHKAAVEGQNRWTAFMAHGRLGRFGSTPQLQPYLLGDNTSMFFGCSRLRAGLTQAQKVNLAENLKAIVANHMLHPQMVPPGLRQFIGTGIRGG